MKKTTKTLGLLMAVLMLGTLLTGCGKKQDATGYVVLEEDLGAEQYGIGFRNTDVALGLEVQKQLDAMIEDGTAAEISQKWFGEDILLKDAAYLEESTAAADDDSLQKVKDKGTLILGLDDSFPPMGFRDENDQVVGFDIDLATEVAKRMGVELVIQPIDWDSKELELETGRVDCLWNGLSITDERVAAMYFAKPYIANKQIVIVPEGSEIKTVADLKEKRVGLQKGSSALDALNANPVSKELSELVELADNVTVFSELKAGRIDAFVVDEVVGRYLISKDAEQAQ